MRLWVQESKLRISTIATLSAGCVASVALIWHDPKASWVFWLAPAFLAVAGAAMLWLSGRLNARAAAVVTSMADGVMSFRRGSHRIVAANTAAESMFGYQPGELCGRNMDILLDRASQDFVTRLEPGDSGRNPAGAMHDGSSIILTGVRSDGTCFPIEVAFSHDVGSGRFSVAVIRDVTERRRVEMDLAESQMFLSAVVENMPSPVIVYDPVDVRYISVNRAYEKVVGVSRELIVGKTNYDLLPQEAAANIARMVADAIAGRDNDMAGTVQSFGPPHARRYLRGTMRVLRDSDDNPKYVLTILDDVTDVYEATRHAQREEQRANLYLRLAETAVAEIAPDGTIARVNAKLLQMLGGNEQDYLGRSYRELPFAGDPADLPSKAALTAVANALESSKAGDIEHFEARLGNRFFRWKAAANRTEGGDLLSVVLVGDDVTEINEKRIEAERANRAKGEFLANMGHELRTPLNAIIGYSEMLEEVARDDARAKDARDLTRIASAGRHLLGLINGILDLSKIESDRIECELTTFDLDHVIEDIRDMVMPTIIANGNELVIDGQSRSPLRTDNMKAKQILLNLVANAAKFTRQGRVEIRYEVNAQSARIEISDTGIGIPPAKLDAVFDAFVQGDGSAAREFGGTGLGLAICDRLCRLLGGRIEVASTEGEGTTFVVTLPQSSRPTGTLADPACPNTIERLAPVRVPPDSLSERVNG